MEIGAADLYSTCPLLFVSEAFGRNAPGYCAYLLFGGVGVIVVGRKITTFWQNRRKGVITEIEKLSENVTGITVKLPETRTFGYFPGQFAYISIGNGQQAEPHPFTIASSPTNQTSLQFMIKNNTTTFRIKCNSYRNMMSFKKIP